MKKKLILASLLCLGALVGCNGGDKPATSTPTPDSVVPPTSEVTPGTSETDPDSTEVNYGSVEAPISIKDARAIIATLQETEAGKGKEKYLTEKFIYTKGVVSQIEMGKNGFKATIKDGTEELGIYYGKTKAGLPDPVVGDEVIVSGLGQNYAGKYQLVADKQGEEYVGPTFEAITGKGEVTPDTPDNPGDTTNFGSLTAPISIKDARAIIATLQETEAGKGKPKYLTEGTIYTKGVVSQIEMGNHGWKATIKDGTEELGIYYGKTKAGLPDPVVGDEVVVSGLGQNYAGKYQLVAEKVGEEFVGPTFESITGKGEVTPDTPDNPGDTTNFGSVEAPISIKDARAIIATLQETEAGKGKPKYLTEETIYTKGVVSQIEMGTHGFKATIKDGTEELGIYYAKTKTGVADPVVGDEVIVSGLGQNYAGKYQLVAEKVGEEFVGPTFEAITGKGEVTPDNPSNPSDPDATSATMQYTGGVTTNLTGEGNEASKVGLDSNLFTVNSYCGDKIDTHNGNVPLFPGLNKSNEIRVYKEGGLQHGIMVTIADGHVIDSVTVTYGKYNKGVAAIRVNDANVELSGGKYLVNNKSFFIGNDGTETAAMKSIVIEYHAA